MHNLRFFDCDKPSETPIFTILNANAIPNIQDHLHIDRNGFKGFGCVIKRQFEFTGTGQHVNIYVRFGNEG